MKTTLKEIKSYTPCVTGWKKLLKCLGKSQADDEELDLMFVLKSNGIKDAVWALRCFDYLDYCLFLADVAESVLHTYEENNKCDVPRKRIQGIRDYKAGKISRGELRDLANPAYAAADGAAAYAAYSAAAAAYAVNAEAAADAVNAAAAAAATYATYATYSAAAAAARTEKWEEIEQLFIKYFGDE